MLHKLCSYCRCGHCKSLAPEWKRAATALKGVVKVGAVDMDVHGSVGGPYNVRGFPTIKVFGANKNSPEDYNGTCADGPGEGPRTAQGIVDSALQEVQNVVKDRLSGRGGRSSGSRGSGGQGSGSSDDVIELTDANFEEKVLRSKDIWLVEFFASWCGQCRQLAPEWAKAASELKGKVHLAALDATVHTVTAARYQVHTVTAARYQVRQLSLSLILPVQVHTVTAARYQVHTVTAARYQVRKLSLSQTLPVQVHTVTAARYQVRGYPTIKLFSSGPKDGDAADYQGGRTASDIVQAALDLHAETIDPPDVVEVVSAEVLKDNCAEKPLCVVSFLPDILDTGASGRNQYLGTLKELGEKYRRKQWGWVWAEAGAQSKVEQALGIGGFGYPAMAAVNLRKKKYVLLKGSFDREGIDEFLKALAVGRGRTEDLQAGLPDARTIAPWDGKDGQPPEEDPDLDLGDLDVGGDKKEEL
ncbi:PDIA6 [Branchiostoma lanceolatum]|uniref:protein disulfide-isomerase n=1 Tax=Branchiostoma lanceolatum TaxID=7740 RepID=A0A8K0EG85_BRALA|nr:PDIA6 [Branchiostoma lanceolatum]